MGVYRIVIMTNYDQRLQNSDWSKLDFSVTPLEQRGKIHLENVHRLKEMTGKSR